MFGKYNGFVSKARFCGEGFCMHVFSSINLSPPERLT
jgi:hypothetical protein